jgi:hypothetical protein
LDLWLHLHRRLNISYFPIFLCACHWLQMPVPKPIPNRRYDIVSSTYLIVRAYWHSSSSFRETFIVVMFRVSIKCLEAWGNIFCVITTMSSYSIFRPMTDNCSTISLILSKCSCNDALSSTVIENNIFFWKNDLSFYEVSCNTFKLFQISTEVFPVQTS